MSQSAMSIPLMAIAAAAPMPWLASCILYIRSHTPTTSLASMAEDQIAERAVGQLADGPRRATRVRLPPADKAALRLDLDQHRIALDRPADAEGDGLLGGKWERRRDRRSGR